MYRLLIIIFLGSSFLLKAQETHFASINNGNFEILLDTNIYKYELKEIIFGEEDSLHFYDRISIVRDSTFGDSKEEYFFILLEDFNLNQKTAKWLEKRGTNLFLIQEYNKKNRLQFYYYRCEGKTNCTPRVGIIGNKKGWSCDETFNCNIDGSCTLSKIYVLTE